MDQGTAALVGAGVGAIAGLAGAVANAFLSGWRQERVEANKRKWALQDARNQTLNELISQLTLKLAPALHSMCWIAWIAKEATNRLTQEQVASYDKEMHVLLPEISGIQTNICSINENAYSILKPIVEMIVRMDAQIGRACLEISVDQARAAGALTSLHGEFLEQEQALPAKMAEIVRQASNWGSYVVLAPPSR